MFNNDRNHDWVLEITDLKQAVIQSSYSMSRSGHVFTKLAQLSILFVRRILSFIRIRRMKKQDGRRRGAKIFNLISISHIKSQVSWIKLGLTIAQSDLKKRM